MAARSSRPRKKPAARSAATPIRVARGAADEAIVARLRAICLALPEAQEKVSHGEPTWFAGAGKVFAMLDDHHHGGQHLSVWIPAPAGAQEVLVGNDPKGFFRPPYVGHKGWVGVVLDGRPKWGLVADLVEQAYRLVAAPRLVARLREP